MKSPPSPPRPVTQVLNVRMSYTGYPGGLVPRDRGMKPAREAPWFSTGATGDVSTQRLNDAIATTALNPSGVGPFRGTFSDPPTQAELQDFAAYVESLHVAIAR